MPALKRFDHKFTMNISPEQLVWLRRQANADRLSAADVIRALIAAEMRKAAQG